MDNVYKINDFEGPLDLLLHLIKDNKMDIFDIEITTLIEQYLNYIEEAKNIDLEIASEFLVMASSLVEMKSKLLLPKPELDEDDYEEDTQEQLIKRLIEYKRYKEVSSTLKEYNETRNLIYTKPLEDLSKFKSEQQALEIPEDLELFDLIRAMEKMQQRLKFKEPITAVFEHTEISVDDRASDLLNQINRQSKKKIAMDDLIDVPTKSYMIVTFLALLDLAKRDLIKINQDQRFDTIYINGVI
ncbi:MAG: segregation/condensation protein A [Erysipelotrichales bacterium]